MLNQRLLRTVDEATGATCTTDTVQILDGVPFDSIATYEFESDAANSVDTGYIGNAAIFNGSSSQIDLNYASLGMGLNDFSYSFWFKTNDTTTPQTFIQVLSEHVNYGIRINNTTGYLQSSPTNSSGGTEYIGATVTLDTDWHHVAYIKSSTTGVGHALYYDGTKIAEDTSFTGNVQTATDNKTTLGSATNDISWLNGSLDQVRFFDKALTQSDVDTLYAETASSTISISGLQAQYKFEGDATDETGNYDGTATNITYNEYDGTFTNPSYTTGKFGNAADFSGTNYIDTSLRVGQNWSVSFWINSSAFSDQQRAVQTFNSIDDVGFQFRGETDGTMLFWVVNGGSSNLADGTIVRNANTWYHIVGTYSYTNSKITLYVNGQQDVSATTNLDVSNSTYPLRIGQQVGNSDSQAYKLDQVRIYDKALSAANVATLYAETVATASTNISLNTPSGVAYYKMNDATDETGSYDGTPTNVNFNVAGKFGNAGEFNGSSSYIDLGNTVIPNQVEKTISLWVYPNVHTSGMGSAIILAVYDQISVYYNTSNQFEIVGGRQSNNNYITFSNVAKSPNQWYHIAISKTNSNIYLYIDGALIQTIGYDGTLSVQNYFNRIGINNTSGPFKFAWNGKIDQVRIFDRAITANEVETLYNEVQCIPTIVPTDYFNPVLYTGNRNAPAPYEQDIVTGFPPDLIFIKDRGNVTNWHVFDVVRGYNNILYTDSTIAEFSDTNRVHNVDSDSFRVSADGGTNTEGSNYISYSWKAGGAAVSNTDGTITSQVSANVDAGFSVVSFTNTSSESSVGHGLNEKPSIVILKATNASGNWNVYTDLIDGSMDFLRLQLTDAAANSGRTLFNSSVFYTAGDTNNYIAYCFHSVDGYSKIGSYTGTGASGNSIVTGFRPAFILLKRTDGASNWTLYDNKRGDNNRLIPNTSAAEGVLSAVNFFSNGFDFQEAAYNNSNETYIFMAFAEENVQPEPELANSFNVVTYTGNGSTDTSVTGVGFQPDLVWGKARTDSISHILFDSVRGENRQISSNTTSAEVTRASDAYLFDPDGFTVTNVGNLNNAEDYVAWCWKASNDSTINQDGSITSIVSANPAAGFSVVSYTGNTSTSLTYGHGLDSAPEMIITKRRSGGNAQNWVVYHTGLTSENYYLELNTTSAELNGAGTAFNSNTSSTVVGIGNSGVVNQSYPYISYCFHSVDGHQKVGSYTGTNAAGNFIETGFQPRFLLTKRSSAAGGGWNIFDSARGTDKRLYPHLSNAEGTDSPEIVTFNSNGFTFNTADSWNNNSSYTYIYLAIA